MTGKNALLMLHEEHFAPLRAPGEAGAMPYVSLARHHECRFVVFLGAVGGDFDVRLFQARDVAGAGEKRLRFTTAFEVRDATAEDPPQMPDLHAARFVVDEDTDQARIPVVAGDSGRLLIVSLHADALDLDGEYTAVRLDFAGTGAGLTDVSALAILSGSDYGGKVDQHVSALED